MHAPRRSALLALVVLAAGLAGCMGGDDGTESSDTNGTNGSNGSNGNSATPTIPTTTTTTGARAHFQVSEIVILPSDEQERPLYEDDDGAIIRYTVFQPENAPGAETAFVSYFLNGRIMDTQQIRLGPGEERAFERTIEGLRDNRSIEVEVRAGSASARNETEVRSWPRAGEDTLRLGPLTVRADYGLLEQDGRLLVNLTLENDGTEEVDDFRMKMLCVDDAGEIQETRSHRIEEPTPGNRTGVDVFVDDCPTPEGRYGLELKGRDSSGDLWGRLLLVPEDWRPPTTDASGTA